jgi:hypothetical protein
LAVAVVAFASVAGFVAAEDGSSPDVEGVLGPRVLPEPAATLRLVWLDPTGAAIGVDGLARDEARSLLGSMGAIVSWRRGAPVEPARPDEVRVILVDRAVLDPRRRPVLGATPPRFEVARFLWVHVPGVRAVIGLRPSGSPGTDDLASSRELAIALGRVVAHEVVHALAPSVPHGTGLMSAALTRRQLTATSIPYDPEVALAVRAALRAALRGEPSLPPAATGVVAATAAEKEVEP